MRKTLLVAAVVVAACLAIVAIAFSGSALGRAEFTFTNGSEPKSLDPHIMTGQPEGRVGQAIFEGLLFEDPATLQPVAGMAERWEESPDGRVWTFHLRRNARWSNGDPVTAHDFYWSWRRALAPETASEYSYMLWDLVNGEQYTKGEIKDFGKVGLKVVDDHTLQVTLRTRVPYFLNLVCFYTLLPVHPPTVEKWEALAPGRWTLPENIVTNGPFLLEKWIVNDRIRLRKNPDYWNPDSIRLETIDALAIDDSTASLNAYLRGEADWNPSYWPPSLNGPIMKRDDFASVEGFIVYYYRINNTRPHLKDPRVRKALSMSVDRKEIVENVLGLGEKEAFTYVPPGIAGYFPPEGIRHDPEGARKLLAEAGYPGGKGFPEIDILYNTNEQHAAIATVIARQISETLSIKVTPSRQEWQSYQQDTRTLKYDLARAGWIGDYLDPNTFLDMWITDGGNNQTGYSNPVYDRLYKIAKDTPDFCANPDESLYAELEEGEKMKQLVAAAQASTTDRAAAVAKVRMQAFREMAILVAEKDFPIIPIYFYVAKRLVKPHIGGCYTWLDSPDGRKLPNVRDVYPLRGFYIKDEAK